MIATLLQGVTAPVTAAAQADDGRGRPALPKAERPVAGSAITKVRPRTIERGPRTPRTEPKAQWPEAGSGWVTLPGASAVAKGTKGLKLAAPVQAGDMPVSVGRPAGSSARTGEASQAVGAVQVRLAARRQTQQAAIDGLLVSLAPKRTNFTDGAAQVRLDYRSITEMYGGGYGARLTLVRLPACALKTPELAKCRTRTPVETVNDTEDRTLTAPSVRLAAAKPTVLAAVAGDSASTGDYGATSLAPSATWQTNLNTGDFAWSYGMGVPEVPGGLKPSIGLSYSSGSVDGRTSETNNQSSWIGSGFDLWPGYIERRYKPCADDGVKNSDGRKPGDSCWAYDNAFISFNGKGGELVPTTTADEFRLRQDDGTRIRRLTSGERGNGDDNGEYWRLTDPDGVRYYFGYNRLPGWGDGKKTTGSTWTAPVFGDDDGEPCHASTFASSWCQQAWRWNLDYVVDPRDNAIAYYYVQEKNSYGRNLKAADDTRYVRGGHLDEIQYGLKSSSVYSSKALAKVTFDNAERCLPNAQTTCSSIGTDSAYWYDTPWDLNCDEGTDCDDGRLSPSFWTRKRLTDVTTQVVDAAGGYQKVDSWKLTHRWGMADIDYQLLLDSIQHTGHTATPAVTLPKTTFDYTQLANRLDKTGDGFAPFIKSRLSSIADEYGGQIDVDYSAPACDWASLPTPQTNTTRCFPQYIGGSSSDDPERQWFNKYVVKSVTATDRTGGAPDQVTAYEYIGPAAWHYADDDGLTKEKFKSWSQWRGYGHVRVKTGGHGGDTALKSQSDTYFLRGMDGDRESPSGGTKNVSVSLGEGEGAAITDHEAFAGTAYKTVVFSGNGGKVLSKTVNRPWRHETAKKTRSWGTTTANFTGIGQTKTWTSLDNGAGAAWRTTSSSTSYDTVAGRITEVDDFGDNSTSADNRCTRTTYAVRAIDADDDTADLFTLPARVETVAKSCADPVDRSKQVIADVRTAYDSKAYGAVPTKGDATATALLKKHDGTTATYLESGATFDSYGRVLTSTDLAATVTVTGTAAPVRTARSDGRTTTTVRTPASGFVTKTTVTGPPAKPGNATTSLVNTTTYGARGLPLTQTDPNGKVTTFDHDALGRASKVWLADRQTNLTPSYAFAYLVGENQPVAVATTALGTNGAQVTAYSIYDGFLRQRQTQKPGPDGGRLLSDVFYDERGLKAKSFETYYATGAPSRTLFKPADALAVETQTRTTHDGMGRPVTTEHIAGNGDGGKVFGTTRTIYGGDRTTVIPPEGGTASTTLTDARGQNVELRQHHQRSAEAAYDSTRYGYTPRGELEKITDPAGNIWSYTYDLLGNVTSADDPDRGRTTTSYDDRGQVRLVSDERTTDLYHEYDGLGRPIELRENSATGPLRAKWVYDTISGAKGHLAESTRFVGTEAYTSKIVAYDRLYRVLRSTMTIPDSEKGLGGTYLSATAYNVDGSVRTAGTPAAGALPATTTTFTYEDRTQRPVALSVSQGIDVATRYSLTGKPLELEFSNNGGKKSWVTNTYEWGTQRLATAEVNREGVPGVDRHNTYRYDEAGNVLSVSDVSRSGTDTQCFGYDYLRRMTTAWTQPTSTCATAPTAEAVGGPAPYWHSYTYDKVGNRRTETLHDLVGDTAKNTVRTYDYPDPGQPRPHALTSVTQTGPGGTARDSYAYDAAGNTRERTLAGTTQKLDWDAEGRLVKVTKPVEGKPDDVTEYLYDADGNRLIARTAKETTLYIGATRVTVAKGSTTAKASRTLDIGGGHQAVLDNDGAVSFTLADHQGSGQLAIQASDQKLTQRRTLPFGGIRGGKPSIWPGVQGFVGGVDDSESTGLQHLGAREYDPATGRFLSVDPLLTSGDPQAFNAYAYSNNSPMTFSDPDGMRCIHGAPGGGADGICAGTPNDTDGVIGPGSNNCPRTSSCYDTAVDMIRSSKSSGTYGKKPILIQPKGDSITIQGVYVPTQAELAADFPYYHERLDYQHNLENWARSKCSNLTVAGGDFCTAVGKLGWFGDQNGPGILEVLGVDNYVGCAKGSGSSCKAAGVDASIAVGTGLLGKGAKVVFKGFKAAFKKGDSIPVQCLVQGAHSFTPGTLVLMSDGSTKPIEDVRVGDEIVVTDPETGRTTKRKVVATIITEDDKHFVDLTISAENGRGTETLTSTATHPFWSPSEGTWVDAGDLKPGMTLRTAAGGTAEVEKTREFHKRQRTHDLTVREVHTYYVLAGQTPVLVHNSTCPNGKLSDSLPRGMNNKIASAYDDVKAGRIPSHDTYGGREHPWWAGSKEYRVPGRPETDRILEKELPNGVKVYGWTSTHYTKIQRFSAPHFPDSGW
ncbi:polymorphic toxin-type HINT domain-containing protein [Streptomyces luteogriseus]|uniref:polymorphic toxin-type HINT domain-containing protein n=1 Tax=Streptomyces luteogriseus TaxID=68233 RepID=UPI002E349553|nr:polymorphic toxin-type HINT domain-containing protein [Streptomyces luteogriseus]WTJ30488.1 polymorphic toxin-type HINT domain-containing protein [Streptomyces luteogriseus]